MMLIDLNFRYFHVTYDFLQFAPANMKRSNILLSHMCTPVLALNDDGRWINRNRYFLPDLTPSVVIVAADVLLGCTFR